MASGDNSIRTDEAPGMLVRPVAVRARHDDVAAPDCDDLSDTRRPLWARHSTASKRFGELKTWAKIEIAKIDRADRKLVTAHNAFGYFCKEYGFEPISILGVSRKEMERRFDDIASFADIT